MYKYVFLTRYNFSNIFNSKARIINAFPELVDNFKDYTNGCTKCKQKRLGKAILLNIIERTSFNDVQKIVIKDILPTDVYQQVIK